MALLLVLSALSGATLAHDSPWTSREESSAYRTECSACHIAFPPALLSADDWLAILADLEHHFGANASLDNAVREQIASFLARNGARNSTFASRDEVPRITTAAWFERKHHGAIRLLLKGRVKTLADCAACHKGPEIDRMTGE